jgi:hypothetical protein
MEAAVSSRMLALCIRFTSQRTAIFIFLMDFLGSLKYSLSTAIYMGVGTNSQVTNAQ